MSGVTLRRIADDAARAEVRRLGVAPEQLGLVATVEKSLSDVDGNPTLTAFAIYEASQQGLPEPTQAPVGFAVSEVVASVGFVLRLLIDAQHQGQGYGTAAMAELVRRLRLDPDVEVVATSHHAGNAAMARLCATLGFEAWATPFPPPADDVYLILRD